MDAIYPAQVYHILLTFVYKCYTEVSMFSRVFICALLIVECPSEWIFIKFCLYTRTMTWKMAQRGSVLIHCAHGQVPDFCAALLGTLKSPALRRCAQGTPPQPRHFLPPLSSSQLPTPCPALSWAEQDPEAGAMRSQRLLEGAGMQAMAPAEST